MSASHLRKARRIVRTHHRELFFEVLESRRVLSASSALSSSGVLEIHGSDEANIIQGYVEGTQLCFNLDGNTVCFDNASVREIRVFGHQGDDRIELRASVLQPALLDGDEDNDRIVGGGGRLYGIGDGGNDFIQGGTGNDLLIGGIGTDQLFGQQGDDTLEGGDGIDLLDGGDGDDRLFGGADLDVLIGGIGRDYFDGGPAMDIILAQDGYVDLINPDPLDIVIKDDFDLFGSE